MKTTVFIFEITTVIQTQKAHSGAEPQTESQYIGASSILLLKYIKNNENVNNCRRIQT